jgi:internalin A
VKLTVSLKIVAILACLLCAVPSALAADEATPAANSEVVSIFPDAALESAVRRQVFAKRNNNEPITAEDVADIAIIEGRGLGIKNLAGLEHCRKVALLNLAENEIADLTPLAGLPRLQSLDLSRNQIKDLQPLVTNTALQYLDLSFNRLRKIEALAGLTNLAALLVSHNNLADVSPAFGLPRLNSLHLDGNRVRSLEGIGGLKRLDLLSAAGNRISKLEPLMELTNLRFLSLEENRVRDLQPLVDMAEKDAQGERRFAPFLRLYLQGNRLDGKKARAQLEQLRKTGVKVHPEPAG